MREHEREDEQIDEFFRAIRTRGILEIVVDDELWDILRHQFLGQPIFKWQREGDDDFVYIQLPVGCGSMKVYRERRIKDEKGL